MTLNIEQLHVLPSLNNDDGEYSYPEKYIGKLYRYEGKILFFQEKKFLEIPLAVVEELLRPFVNQTEFDDLLAHFNDIKDSTENKLDNVTQLMDTVGDTLSELSNRVGQIEQSTESLQSLEGISEAMDEKLQTVHDNFKIVAETIVKEQMEDYIETLKKSANKLKPTTVAIYKEMGIEIKEIIEMAKDGLI
ncbi:MAG: hypothetical protein DRG78_05400 [Epsilonproteobacteria bacterium]|nr:MAG: hypothetical protein DRG78_05400 [Campylobacterota bacterium]